MRLLTVGSFSEKLRGQGRAWVEAHYASQMVCRQVDWVYVGLLGATGGRD